MKTLKLWLLSGLLFVSGITLAQQKQVIDPADSTGLPGDHFSLQGALAMFKEAKSLEDFEKRINSKDHGINNLDLNGDGKVDYVRVIADKKGDAHVVILQTPVSTTESQDVAVIEIEKRGDQSATLQIIGSEALYGEMKIVEPKEDGEPGDPGVQRKGPSAFIPHHPPVFVNVWFWPCIRIMYAPVYIVYVSPWYWNYYPVWWSPWHPFSWRYHYMHTWHYHHHYHVVYNHRVTAAHQVYAPRRTTSAYVDNRYRDARQNYKATHQSKPRTAGPQQQAKPVTRPQQGGVQSKPGTRSDEAPSAKPQTRPQVKPDRPVDRDDQMQHQTRPQTKPQVRPQQDPAPRPQKPQQQVRPQKQPKQSVQPSSGPGRSHTASPAGRPQSPAKPKGGGSKGPR
jgi:hypothetical protein